MASIDWRAIERRAWKPTVFSPAQIAAAQKAVAALPSVDDNPDHIALLWQQADKFPDISDIDLGDATQQVLNLAQLQAATDATHNWLSRPKVLAHLTNPGVSTKRNNPFTAAGPLVVTKKKGDQLIVDGHHRLAALMFLGAKSWQMWNVPTAAALNKSKK